MLIYVKYVKTRFSPKIPGLSVSELGPVDSKPFFMLTGEISCRNNIGITGKRPTSGLDFRPEIEKLTVQKLRSNCICPQSFMRIGKQV